MHGQVGGTLDIRRSHYSMNRAHVHRDITRELGKVLMMIGFRCNRIGSSHPKQAREEQSITTMCGVNAANCHGYRRKEKLHSTSYVESVKSKLRFEFNIH